MAQFSSVHQELVIENIKFRKGLYSTNDKEEIAILSKPYVQNLYHIIRLDKDSSPESVREELLQKAINAKNKATNKK